MGFCNEKLNRELLLKNNFDIHCTVQDLFFSIGNNSFSPTTSPTKAPTATSASPLAGTVTGDRPAQKQQSEEQKKKEKPSKSSVSIN